jgi:predicted O-linked N-acetylglucosamine transferase (SPINDLY family)
LSISTISETLAQAMQHHQDGNLVQAEQFYRQVLRANPDEANALHLLGMVVQHLGRYEEAVDLLHRAIAVAPQAAAFHYNLGWLQKRREKPEEAQASFEQALRLQPAFAEALDGLASALKDQGRVDEAIVFLHRAIAAKPQLNYIHSNLFYALHFPPTYDPEAVFRELRRWGAQFEHTPSKRRPWQELERTPGRRLRVGYVSPDFCEHVVGRYCEAVIKAHDRDQVEVFCYASVLREDERTRRIQGWADHWRNILPLSNEQAADAIVQDRIDVLVDLAGHTGDNRLPVFAFRPAAIQMTHFGFPVSTGLTAMDYRLTDAYCDPPGTTEQWHCEKLVRMPELQFCYVPWPSPEPGPLPALRTGDVTFASFNTFAKVTDEMIGVWSRILSAVDGSRLLLVTGVGKAANDRVRIVFGRHGIGPERVLLLDRQTLDAFLKLHQQVDIALDTFPFTGCNTTADSLWMGVPVVSQAGPTAITRQGVALLTPVGLEDLVVHSAEGYVEAAVRLARELPRLQELREQMRERVRRTLADVARFARNLEAVYRELWERLPASSTR